MIMNIGVIQTASVFRTKESLNLFEAQLSLDISHVFHCSSRMSNKRIAMHRWLAQSSIIEGLIWDFRTPDHTDGRELVIYLSHFLEVVYTWGVHLFDNSSSLQHTSSMLTS